MQVFALCLQKDTSNPVGTSEFILDFISNCLSYFTTAKISFTSIFYPQFTHMVFIIYTITKRYFHNVKFNMHASFQHLFRVLQLVAHL